MGRAEITLPRLTVEPLILRPESANNEEVLVALELLIDVEGRVQEARATAGPEPFASAAELAARGLRFEPARRGDVAVAARIRFLVRFPKVEDVAPAPAPSVDPSSARAPDASSGNALVGNASAGSAAAGSEAKGAAPAPAAVPPPAAEVTVLGATPVGIRGFTRAEIRMLPGALKDPLRAIEALPGVTPTLSGAPYFFVRGAPPGNLGYFFDDVRLPALFHAIAGPSVVHPALIDDVTLYSGPYPVQYGRFAGGVVVSRAAEPAPVAHAEVSLKATESSGLLDSPLDTATHLTVAGRYAYADPVLHLFAPNMHVEYWDYQARVTRDLSDTDRLSLFAFGAHDLLTQTQDGETRTNYGIDFHRLNLRSVHRMPTGTLTVASLFGTGRTVARGGDVLVDDVSTSLRVDLLQALWPAAKLMTGMDLGLDKYRLDLGGLDDPAARRDFAQRYPSRLDSVGGAYVALDLEVARGFDLTPGVRADVYQSRGVQRVGVDPRLKLEYQVTPRVTLESNVGIAHQAPASGVPSPGLDPTLGEGLQTSLQESYGIRLSLPHQLQLEATLFQSAFFNLADSIGQSRLENVDEAISVETRGLGSSRGVELLLRRSFTQELGGYFAYTLSQTTRSIGRAQGPSSFDRRHVVSGALNYAWGNGFSSGARGTFYTGIPADVAYLEAAREPPRTSAFWRVDVRTEKVFVLPGTGTVALFLEVVNATLNQEALFASCNAYRCRERQSGPVTIPNVGIDAAF